MSFDREGSLGKALFILQEASRILTLAILNRQEFTFKIRCGLNVTEHPEQPGWAYYTPNGGFEVHLVVPPLVDAVLTDETVTSPNPKVGDLGSDV
jgi:hypothetical protein